MIPECFILRDFFATLLNTWKAWKTGLVSGNRDVSYSVFRGVTSCC